MDPTNYFIVVLSGFVVVWIFRFWTASEETLGEFEYAALSALWGIPLAFLLIVYLQKPTTPQEVMQLVNVAPMTGTLMLLPSAFVVGSIAAFVLGKLWRSLKEWTREHRA
jgi:hypothetical protein